MLCFSSKFRWMSRRLLSVHLSWMIWYPSSVKTTKFGSTHGFLLPTAPTICCLRSTLTPPSRCKLLSLWAQSTFSIRERGKILN
ncbi:hypothetical protein CPB85DRAFT_988490 [Mucidula mucida]|nr:hypothetical protein CPB85DRAFT_988490 [Mucidula mucida]